MRTLVTGFGVMFSAVARFVVASVIFVGWSLLIGTGVLLVGLLVF